MTLIVFGAIMYPINPIAGFILMTIGIIISIVQYGDKNG